MQIKVLSYDPIKGKGVLLHASGAKENFRHQQFFQDKMFIGLGELDEYGLFQKKGILPSIKWFFRRLRHGYHSE